MINGYIVDTLSSVDIQEFFKIEGKVIQIYQGVIYKENIKISAFGKVIEKLFASGKKYKDEKINLGQGLVKLILNSLYGVEIRKYNKESYYCQSEIWMKTEYDENVLDYWKLPKGFFLSK